MDTALLALEDALGLVLAAIDDIDTVADGWWALQKWQELLGRTGTGTEVKQALETRTGDLFESDTETAWDLDGAEVLIVRRRPGRQEWHDEDELFGLVRDSRVNTATGEVMSPLDCVLLAYGSVNRKTGLRRLASPKVEGLKQLGIVPDDFREWRPTRKNAWEVSVPRA